MRLRKDLLRSIISFVLFLSVSSIATERLPVEAFASLPDITQIQLSPSGEKLLYVSRVNDADDLYAVVLNLDTEKIVPIAKSDNEEFKLGWLAWANDSQVLASVRFPAVRFGAPTTETRLLIFDASGKKKYRSVLSPSFFRKLSVYPQFQDDVIDFIPDDPDSILLSVPREDLSKDYVYRINLKNRKRTAVQRPRAHVIEWLSDRQHRVRANVALDEKEYRINFKGTEPKAKWQELARFEAFSEEQVWPIGFDKNPNILYVHAYHEGRLAIFKIDLASEAKQRELVFSDDDFDVDGGLVYSGRSGDVVGTTYSNGQGYTYWDEGYKRLQKALNKAFPEENVRFVSFNADETRAIIFASSDRNPGEYFLFDKKKKQVEAIARKYNNLVPEKLAEKKSYFYKARDGLDIGAFLTLPVGRVKQNLPAIIFPHGGPISYDDGGFDYWTQFFANRGYAVLQMNFRGSSGYGYDFMKAGLQGWGKAMQDDVEDGVLALVNEGIIDKDRICIAGASYGGYAALMGAVKTPDLYQCVISFAGISDVNMKMQNARKYMHHEIAEEQIGSKRKELKIISPVNFIDSIEAPILLLHGEEDRVVNKRQSRKMYKRLKRSGKSVEYIEMENGGHYLQNNQNRLTVFKAMDAFLAKHLPVETE